MRHIKLLVLALLTIFTASIAVGTADALEFKMLPANPKFIFKNETPTRFEALSKKAVECEKVTGTGSFTSERLGTLELKFQKCKGPFSTTCTGLADEAGNITVQAEFHLRHLLMEETNKPLENASLMALVGHVHFSCSIDLLLVLGSMCSDDLLIAKGGAGALNRLLAAIYVDFLIQAKGDPAVKTVDGDNSLSMEECALLIKEGSGEYESAALQAEGFMEKCEPNACIFLIDLSGTY